MLALPTLLLSPRLPALRLCAEDRDAAAAVVATQKWIEDHVIRIGLCPYASEVFYKSGQIRYAVSEAADGAELMDDFFVEGRLLLDTEPDELATTMLIAPHYEGDIEAFYELYEVLVEVLEDEEETVLGNEVQPAFFHPEWTFAGEPSDSPLHFEKRAPHTVINLLRREQLEAVVEAGLLKGTVVNKKIAEHNARALQAEGYEALETVFRGLMQTGAGDVGLDSA